MALNSHFFAKKSGTILTIARQDSRFRKQIWIRKIRTFRTESDHVSGTAVFAFRNNKSKYEQASWRGEAWATILSFRRNPSPSHPLIPPTRFQAEGNSYPRLSAVLIRDRDSRRMGTRDFHRAELKSVNRYTQPGNKNHVHMYTTFRR